MTYTFPKDFSEPVLALCALGEDAARQSEWIDYQATLGLKDEHIPELIRIVEDIEIFMPEDEDVDEDAPEIYAPIHAWRALGQLKAEQAIPALMDLTILNDDLNIDWIMEEMPETMAMIGLACIHPLREYLLNPRKLEWASAICSSSLEKIGMAHSKSRTDCVKALEDALENYADNDPGVNAFIIASLAGLNASESDATVKRVFNADAVNLTIIGDYEDYQVKVGLREKRKTPVRNYFDEKFHIKEMMQGFEKDMRIKKQADDLFALVDPKFKKGK